MEWLLAVLVAGGGGLAAIRRLSGRRTQRRVDAEELAGVRAMADEDVTLLGEQLQRLGSARAGAMDEATRLDYQTALDAYESAKRAVPRLRSAGEVSAVVDTLSAGRYALACVQARLAGLPTPELRTPCFFNPQHGPSVRDVRWTQPGRGTRTVPACAQDAARVTNGELPEIRQVRVGAHLAPYWEAGDAFLPYGRPYFISAVLEAGLRAQSQAPGGFGGIGGA